ncbi:cysteine desulfurase [Subsaximicrobium wynnwilliamsii]|uniref:cysteine desulfurase n=1 Tax=Subsaximicrobium wynnwilliamsii TaxID=291179 RepID=A0A5C6ZRE0_9FLAO|nr:cysteine desulfurase family protein [Subsaximicrobium wynnwilliamsii]TXD85117.1 cysteine desulfurase [Subsaximicrobium wynnwilliamsii]TXD91160.1 cysteine desulfurase [Subsaximicrobium wynnwilliamsii]TXE04554.1 cysteine desulfurase [Subsaximicrobium wynnwilliamsii]
MKSVYFDSAATTQMRDEVIERMANVMKDYYGNPSSTHGFGRHAKSLLETSRKTIASFFNVSAAEIIFTSGGTEADNLVLRSAVKDLGVTEIISSKIEHHAVLHTLDELQKEFPISVNYVNVLKNGHIDMDHLEQLLQSPKKTLVSLMHINNEIGNLLNIERVANLCKAHQALFHSDTVQSVGHYQMDLQEIPIDFMAASAHKFHGPKGVGFAFLRKNSGLRASIYGGEQERGLRAGTESIHNIVGMADALSLAYKHLEAEQEYTLSLKTYFIDQLQDAFPDIQFNGDCANPEGSTYTLLNVCLPFTADKASLLSFQLDLKGIACSRGSACQSGSSQNSHVLTAILEDDYLKRPSLRFSFSSFNTKEDIDYVVEVLKEFSGNGMA